MIKQPSRAARGDADRKAGARSKEIARLKRHLEDSLQRFAEIAGSTTKWSWKMDASLRFSSLSPRFFEIFLIAREDVIGKTSQEFAGASADDEHWRQHLDDLANRRPFRDFAYTAKQAGGPPQYILISGEPVFDANGVFKGYRGTGTDKTAEVEVRGALAASQRQFSELFTGVGRNILDGLKAEEVLQKQNEELRQRDRELNMQNERFNAALDNMSQGLCMFDAEQRLVVCNQRYASMYGLSPEQVKPGTQFRQILAHRIANAVYAGDVPEKYIEERCAAVVEAKASKKTQTLTDGRSIVISHQPLVSGGWLATHEDITDYRRIERRLAYLAYHDALTDLPNRVLLRERLDEELKRARRGDGFALFYLDLDGFKGVNDTLGHSAGDTVLKAVAQRLSDCIRETDMVARLGGDEFAIIQAAAKQPLDATALAERICDAISAPVDLGHQEVVVGATIGIAFAPQDGSDAEQLLKNADMALYRAKSTNRGAYNLFKPEMETTTMGRHALGLDLRRALARDEFELYYQPLFNLKENKIMGFEALLRWHRHEWGMVPPVEFIPVAEETGLIIEIGEWVLHQACAEAANWPDDIKIAVNVSPVQFKRGNLLEVVKKALSTSGLCPGRLELEVTESVVLQDDGATLAMLHQLQKLGVWISLDDFGTGYSSLSYLRRFPFDKIKIDASFVSDLSAGIDGIGIVHAVVNLATRLRVTTTAEGVETQEQLEIVTAEGCTEAQGYLFSRPMPAKDIAHLLPRRRRKLASAAA